MEGAPGSHEKEGTRRKRSCRVNIAVRCRPLSEEEVAHKEEQCVGVSEDDSKLVVVTDPTTRQQRLFHFDHVFDESTSQREMHRALGRTTLRSFWDGIPASLLAYGPTGSGKTHSILGPSIADGSVTEDSGLLPRMLQDTFKRLRKDARRLGHSIPDGPSGGIVIPDAVAAEAAAVVPRAGPDGPSPADVEHAWPAYGVARAVATYVEMYSGRIFDLLADEPIGKPGQAGGMVRPGKSRVPGTPDKSASVFSSPGMSRKRRGKLLQVREREDGSTFVENAARVPVGSWADVQAVLRKGERRRAVAETAANVSSSRSHAVFTLELDRRDVDDVLSRRARAASSPEAVEEQLVVRCKLVVVDLAGSESSRAGAAAAARAAKAKGKAKHKPGAASSGKRLREEVAAATHAREKEAIDINSSLTALGHVISALAEVDAKTRHRDESSAAVSSSSSVAHVNYRNSQLTWLLKDCLGRQSATTLLANVAPCTRLFRDTTAALRFVERAANIRVDAEARKEVMRAVSRHKQGIRARQKEKERESRLKAAKAAAALNTPPERSHDRAKELTPSPTPDAETAVVVRGITAASNSLLSSELTAPKGGFSPFSAAHAALAHQELSRAHSLVAEASTRADEAEARARSVQASMQRVVAERKHWQSRTEAAEAALRSAHREIAALQSETDRLRSAISLIAAGNRSGAHALLSPGDMPSPSTSQRHEGTGPGLGDQQAERHTETRARGTSHGTGSVGIRPGEEASPSAPIAGARATTSSFGPGSGVAAWKPTAGSPLSRLRAGPLAYSEALRARSYGRSLPSQPRSPSVASPMPVTGKLLQHVATPHGGGVVPGSATTASNSSPVSTRILREMDAPPSDARVLVTSQSGLAGKAAQGAEPPVPPRSGIAVGVSDLPPPLPPPQPPVPPLGPVPSPNREKQAPGDASAGGELSRQQAAEAESEQLGPPGSLREDTSRSDEEVRRRGSQEDSADEQGLHSPGLPSSRQPGVSHSPSRAELEQQSPPIEMLRLPARREGDLDRGTQRDGVARNSVMPRFVAGGPGYRPNDKLESEPEWKQDAKTDGHAPLVGRQSLANLIEEREEDEDGEAESASHTGRSEREEEQEDDEAESASRMGTSEREEDEENDEAESASRMGRSEREDEEDGEAESASRMGRSEREEEEEDDEAESASRTGRREREEEQEDDEAESASRTGRSEREEEQEDDEAESASRMGTSERDEEEDGEAESASRMGRSEREDEEDGEAESASRTGRSERDEEEEDDNEDDLKPQSAPHLPPWRGRARDASSSSPKQHNDEATGSIGRLNASSQDSSNAITSHAGEQAPASEAMPPTSGEKPMARQVSIQYLLELPDSSSSENEDEGDSIGDVASLTSEPGETLAGYVRSAEPRVLPALPSTPPRVRSGRGAGLPTAIGIPRGRASSAASGTSSPLSQSSRRSMQASMAQGAAYQLVSMMIPELSPDSVTARAAESTSPGSVRIAGTAEGSLPGSPLGAPSQAAATLEAILQRASAQRHSPQA